METKRKQAPRLARPAARYWKGKAPKGVTEAESESEDEGALSMEEEGDVPIGGDQDIVEEEEEEMPLRTDVRAAAKLMNVTLKDVNISKEGKVIVAGREESGRTVLEEEEESEEEEEEEDEKHRVQGLRLKVETDESSEYETDSEEDEKPQLKFRPVFVPKRARVTITEKDALADEEEASKKRELEAEERRKQSHDMVAESIKRELAEKEKEEDVNDVDDTDGLDPTAEFEAWRLRELGRIKAEKEEEVRREEEQEEVERRRALPEEQRMKEDVKRAQKLREEKPKGQQRFLQKYWHKGAFHQDQEILTRRDYTAPTASAVDVSLLPKVMQVKDFGKRSRTKYTHLLDQDTTATTGGFGGTGSVKAGGKGTDGGGCFTCGGPHLKKDCPQNTGPLSERGATGSNAAPTGPRRWGNPPEAGSWRGADDAPRRDSGWKTERDQPRDGHSRGAERDDRSKGRRGESERWHDRSRERYDKHSSRRRSRSRSRSRSPYYGGGRDYAGKERRRSRERPVDDYREKRRRLD
ncbi:microfibrillar-associated protein MFAP1, Zn finger, CCHC type protein [Lyophyllum atratum]|nr:microfibrillar-associated protein MFAP1, Zn finger, CCHC type protein [Lyophyllum atratum]